jgi:hypothetical protein
MRGGGQSLPPSERAFFEPRFGQDFGDVRVHVGERAARSAKAIGALAYTAGSDVVFGDGQFSPGLSEGRKLLAHELTHVVQQRGGGSTAAVQRQTQGPPTPEQRNAARTNVVAIAMADVGTVKAKETVDGKRVGHEHLKEMFDIAWPSHKKDGVSDETIQTPKNDWVLQGGKDYKSKRPSSKGGEDPEGNYKWQDTLPSWCGVGATYWAKRAYPGIPDWVMSKGISHLLTRRGKTETPQVGDLVIRDDNLHHHGIVSKVDPNAKPGGDIPLETVQANVHQGQIAEGSEPLSYWTAGVYDPEHVK